MEKHHRLSQRGPVPRSKNYVSFRPTDKQMAELKDILRKYNVKKSPLLREALRRILQSIREEGAVTFGPDED